MGIKDFVVVAGTEGFTDIKTGEVHDLAEMLTSFTVADLIPGQSPCPSPPAAEPRPQ